MTALLRNNWFSRVPLAAYFRNGGSSRSLPKTISSSEREYNSTSASPFILKRRSETTRFAVTPKEKP